MSYYPQQTPPPYYRQPPATSGLSVAGMVLGIVGILFSWIPIFGGILGCLAIVFGSVGFRETTKYVDASLNKSGTGMAITGLATGFITVLIQVIFFVIVVTV